jgi:hypothetical protein
MAGGLSTGKLPAWALLAVAAMLAAAENGKVMR